MKRCPITYDNITEQEDYSLRGLQLLDPQLTSLHPLSYSAAEQRQEALRRVEKISIQGVQLKLSASLSVPEKIFKIVDQQGDYILKPPSLDFFQLPENEDLTMKLASLLGIETPLHGLVYGKERELSYFIKRFDRAKKERFSVEDFAQLLGESRETKYESSMEKVASVIWQYTTAPEKESLKLFERVLFNFLVGNEDMHLKNFSLITLHGHTMLSPAYDFVNTTIVLGNTREELALPLAGKKSRLTQKDFFDYFAYERLKLSEQALHELTCRIKNIFPSWHALIDCSFLNEENKQQYRTLVEQRISRLF